MPLSSDDQWYVLKNEQKYGPVKFGDLANFAKQKLLLENDWVWRYGLEQWIVARDVSGLFTIPAQLRGEAAQINLTVVEEYGGQEHIDTLKERALSR